jgi:hypothetical protein
MIVFAQPVNLPGFDEQLPAGDYTIETELSAPPDHRHPARWKASVMVNLHPRVSHPGLSLQITVSLADLDGAIARDKLTGKQLATFVFDSLLADPMVRLAIQADEVSETQMPELYGASGDESREAPEPSEIGSGEDRASVDDDPVELDARRSSVNRIAADLRRHALRDFESDQLNLRRRREELESQLLAEPSRNRHEAAIRAQYLIRRYAETAEARDPRRQKLVERALGDLARPM